MVNLNLVNNTIVGPYQAYKPTNQSI